MAKHKLSQLPKMDRLLAREELAGCGLPYPLVRRAARQASSSFSFSAQGGRKNIRARERRRKS